MSDDLAIGRPGATSVVTTKLEEAAGALRALHAELGRYRRELAALDRIVTSAALSSADAPISAMAAERAIDDAEAGLARSEGTSERMAHGLGQAAGRYEFAEGFASRAAQSLAALFGYDLGFFLPVLALCALAGLTAAGGAAALTVAGLPQDQRRALYTELAGWAGVHKGALSDPRVVELVRLSVMSADDFGGGALHLPFAATHLLGDEGLGIVGPDSSAAAVRALAAPFGMLAETPISVRMIRTEGSQEPARGFRERAGRIPTDGTPVRIDRISAPGQADRFEVYLAGTSDFSLTAGDDPWDMTSNLSAIAGGSAGSYRAAQEAMAQAGITAASPVVFTGYSQGGLIAARLAASGDYHTTGLVTLGGPAGQVSVPNAIPYVAVEHTEDIVPATGGTFASSQPVLVRRSVFDGHPPDGPAAFPAHQLARYRQTAGLLDASSNPRVTDALRAINGPSLLGTTVTSTFYTARRG